MWWLDQTVEINNALMPEWISEFSRWICIQCGPWSLLGERSTGTRRGPSARDSLKEEHGPICTCIESHSGRSSSEQGQILANSAREPRRTQVSDLQPEWEPQTPCDWSKRTKRANEELHGLRQRNRKHSDIINGQFRTLQSSALPR